MRTTYFGKDGKEYLEKTDAVTYGGGLDYAQDELGVDRRKVALTAEEKRLVLDRQAANRAKNYELYGTFDRPDDIEEVEVPTPSIDEEELIALRKKALQYDALMEMKAKEKEAVVEPVADVVPTVELADGTSIAVPSLAAVPAPRKPGRPANKTVA